MLRKATGQTGLDPGQVLVLDANPPLPTPTPPSPSMRGDQLLKAVSSPCLVTPETFSREQQRLAHAGSSPPNEAGSRDDCCNVSPESDALTPLADTVLSGDSDDADSQPWELQSIAPGSWSLTPAGVCQASQQYETPLYPCGCAFKLVILSSWGDPFYVGLNGIELFDSSFARIPLS